MGRKITLVKDYYNKGENIFTKKTITINPGVTVLVGCNGIGKSTLLHQIRTQLKKEAVPCITFDNLRDGGNNSMQEALFNDDVGFVSTLACSSEGEGIIVNLGRLVLKLKHFVETGKDVKSKMQMAFDAISKKEQKEEKEAVNERWILLDAIDSGLSIDNIIDVKNLFKTILEQSHGNDIYIVVAANSYEMASGEQCFDVHNGKYVEFTNYEKYKEFILRSKEYVNQRYDSEET